MEMQQLRYFRVVAELQHVTKAATKLSVSQSAVSRAIRQMEEELGVPLFVRQGRAIVLTRYGAMYLEHVIRAQAALDSGERKLKEESGEQAGTISLGFLGSLGTDMVPKLIRDFRRKYPLVKFNLIQRSAETMVDELMHGTIDLLFSVPGMFPRSEISWTHLLDEEIVIALPERHRLAGRRSLRLQELTLEPFLTLTRGHTIRTIFDQACEKAGIEPHISFEGRDMGTLRGLIAAGLGVGLMPSSPRFSGIVEVKFAQNRIVRPLGIGWIEGRYLPPCSVAFLKMVQSQSVRLKAV
jgi:LysR family transcriptional activator of glutamate synthase operon